jgi:uncharacterized damage-inducible protein DinB
MSSVIPIRSTRPDPAEHAPYFGTYIGKVPDGDIVQHLRDQVGETVALLRGLSEAQAGRRYAEGKWSIREVVGHVTDAERIFGYRALRFARGDETPIPGFDENRYVERSRQDARPLAELCDAFEAVRGATIALYAPLDEDEWLRRGSANGNSFTVRALAWITAGHERHHRDLLRTRYL